MSTKILTIRLPESEVIELVLACFEARDNANNDERTATAASYLKLAYKMSEYK